MDKLLLAAGALVATFLLMTQTSAGPSRAHDTRATQQWAAGWKWECNDCDAGGSANTKDAANEAGKAHERANKGHTWDVTES